MAINKFMSKDISDLSKIMNIDRTNLSGLMGVDIPTGTVSSGTFYITTNEDDGHCLGRLNFDNFWNGSVIGNYLGDEVDLYFRFLNITIPKDATITDAFIKFTASNSQSSSGVNVNLNFGNVDNAEQPTSCGGMAGIGRTSNVAWNSIPAWLDDTQYDTPQLKDVLQTVINRVGWSSGNALIFFVMDNNCPNNTYRGVQMHNYSSGADRAELWITWTT
jgi:type IV pilus assembly protein PilY1